MAAFAVVLLNDPSMKVEIRTVKTRRGVDQFMFNRETTGFLLVLWALDRFASGVTREAVIRAAGLAAVVAAVYLGMRWARGFESYRLVMLPENLQILKILPAGFDPYTRVAGYFWLALFGPLTFFAIKAAGRPGAPPIFRASLMVGAMFFAVAWLFAAIIELRVLVPLVPLLLPAVLSYFVGVPSPARTAESPAAR